MISQGGKKIDFLLLTLFSIYPIAILVGNFTINLFIFILGIIFLYKLFKNNKEIKINKLNLFLLTFFFISLCINLIFTNNFYLSYQRVLKFFFVILFIFSFNLIIKNYHQELRNIFRAWFIIFLLVILDLFIELTLGKNILGQSTMMSGRLGSFTGEEAVIGGFFLGFSLIFLSYVYEKYDSIILNLFLAAFLIIISFFIGERANFIRTFLAILLYIFLAYKMKYKIKFILLSFILFFTYLIFLTTTSTNSWGNGLLGEYKMRYIIQIKKIFDQSKGTKFLENSQYGAHRNVAKEIFLDNPIFGVGIKNFRIESRSEKYDNLNHLYNHIRGANHPHELYYEFLSETGIFGLSSFLIFIFTSIIFSIKNFIKEKNIYQLSGLIYILVAILPIIPAGAFFSTYISSIFWINYAIMIGFNNAYKN
jgi:O-antigen ligase